MKEIIKITIKSTSEDEHEKYAYNDKITIAKNSVSYEYKPTLESEENIAEKWSYKTTSRDFQKLFDDIVKLIPEILTSEENWLALSSITFVVTYSDKTKEERIFFLPGDEFREVFMIARQMVPPCEKIPKVLKMPEEPDGEYELDLTGDIMFSLWKETGIEDPARGCFEFGVGDKYYLPTTEFEIYVDGLDIENEISGIWCQVTEGMLEVQYLELPGKDDLQRRPTAILLPPKHYRTPMGSQGEFTIYYTEHQMKIQFREGKAYSYYADKRLEAYYDKNEELLFFVVNFFKKSELSTILENRRKMLDKRGYQWTE